MAYHKKPRKFGRKKNVRTALIRSLASALIRYGKIETTEARAKELRPFIERLVTISRKGTIAGRRLATARLGTTVYTKKLFSDIGPKYKDRNGGYTRITKLPPAPGKSGKAIIEFV